MAGAIGSEFAKSIDAAIRSLHGVEEGGDMTHVVTDACIRCKYMDCIQLCPVECFHEGENMVVIDPRECIDCGICIPECPADAIVADTGDGLEKWIELNERYSASWPGIFKKGEKPADADVYRDEGGKYEKYFSPEPGGRS